MNLLFAWRYFKSKKSTNAINIIAWISVLAIAVGTASLIIVLSVFNGFENLVKGLYGDFYSDIKVSPSKGKFVQITDASLKKIQAVAGIEKTSRVVEEKAVLVNGESQSIVFLKGVDENYGDVNKLTAHIIRGNYRLGVTDTPLLVVGAGIENAVRADPEGLSNGLVIYLPNRSAVNYTGIEDAMNSYEVNVAGTFMVQQEFDNKYAFTNLDFVQYMLSLKPDEYSGLEVHVADPEKMPLYKEQIEKVLGPSFKVQTRYEQNQGLYSIMQMEKWVIYGILSLILVVAAFNMIGALTMLVLEKQKDIAVLKAMGATNSMVQKIFLSEGFVLAGIGGIAGMLVALLVCFLQVHFHLIKLEGGTFIINYYPVQLSVFDFLLVGATVTLVAIAAAWIPARKAGAQQFSLKS
ncbi:FtsX-like permease family protein [Foetidibacter luteolus]|uniref:FtsX-like permease family protein n=1 Tax=Foetidibacter luteolus TaxID=2608880 RepID=UPI00129A82E7|nr:FtsX-like permease family protein [Foetidibacter luteolus]